MHEFSIAEALAGQVLRHAPAGSRVLSVEMRAGALRAIEPEALRMCWDAVTHDTTLAGSTLVVDSRPWTLDCAECGRSWESAVPFAVCECGNPSPVPTAGDELYLVSLTVDDEAPEAALAEAVEAAPAAGATAGGPA